MFKSLLTLFRGTTYETAAATVEGNIVTILDQQFLDCTRIVEKARKAAALAIAQQRQEKDRFDSACHGIADLEARTKWALDDGDEVLAREAAEVIASLESERDAARKGMRAFDMDTRRLTEIIRTTEMQLEDLMQGRGTVRAADGAQSRRDRGYVPDTSGINALADTDAEMTLERLRLRQKEIDNAFTALDAMDRPAKPVLVAREGAEAKGGEPAGSTADAVLARLGAPKHSQYCSY